MADLLVICSVAVAGAVISILLGLPFEPAFAVTVIGVLFTVVWIMSPITPRD